MFSSLLPIVTIMGTSICLSTALPHQGTEFHQIKSRINKRDDKRYDYVAYAVAGIEQLQTWYDTSDGLWDKAWWPSANVVTLLAGLQEYFPSYVESLTEEIFPNTLSQAPNKFPDFLNGFYDDELWWALAWIKVYDVTQNVTYLNTAAAIFEDSKSVWGQTPCGGLWWDKNHTQVGAVENELYLSTAAKLANRLPEAPHDGYYLNEAMKAYTWFRDSSLINGQNLINNGLDLKTCQNDGNPIFSYNQGIILSGLVELSWATNDNQYIDLANAIATAAISTMTDSDGVLHDFCEPDGCNEDMERFKGIFSLNVQFIYKRCPNIPAESALIYEKFLLTNADVIWAKKTGDNQLGLVWSGPNNRISVQTQSSALDAIIGAAAVS